MRACMKTVSKCCTLLIFIVPFLLLLETLSPYKVHVWDADIELKFGKTIRTLRHGYSDSGSRFFNPRAWRPIQFVLPREHLKESKSLSYEDEMPTKSVTNPEPFRQPRIVASTLTRSPHRFTDGGAKFLNPNAWKPIQFALPSDQEAQTLHDANDAPTPSTGQTLARNAIRPNENRYSDSGTRFANPNAWTGMQFVRPKEPNDPMPAYEAPQGPRIPEPPGTQIAVPTVAISQPRAGTPTKGYTDSGVKFANPNAWAPVQFVDLASTWHPSPDVPTPPLRSPHAGITRHGYADSGAKFAKPHDWVPVQFVVAGKDSNLAPEMDQHAEATPNLRMGDDNAERKDHTRATHVQPAVLPPNSDPLPGAEAAHQAPQNVLANEVGVHVWFGLQDTVTIFPVVEEGASTHRTIRKIQTFHVSIQLLLGQFRQIGVRGWGGCEEWIGYAEFEL